MEVSSPKERFTVSMDSVIVEFKLNTPGTIGLYCTISSPPTEGPKVKVVWKVIPSTLSHQLRTESVLNEDPFSLTFIFRGRGSKYFKEHRGQVRNGLGKETYLPKSKTLWWVRSPGTKICGDSGYFFRFLPWAKGKAWTDYWIIQ